MQIYGGITDSLSAKTYQKTRLKFKTIDRHNDGIVAKGFLRTVKQGLSMAS
jgi:hypothetical protein